MKRKVRNLVLGFAFACVLFAGNAIVAQASQAGINWLNVWKESDGIAYDFEGNGSKFEVYVNDTLYTTIDNEQYETMDNYDEQGEATTIEVPIAAPFLEAHGQKASFDLQAGAAYTIKVKAYEYGSTEDVSMTSEVLKTPFQEIADISAFAYGEPVYDKDGNTNGFEKVSGVQVGFSSDSNSGMQSSYAIYRSTKEKSGYKKVGIVTSTTVADTGFCWTDSEVKQGKTYYYKVRPVVLKDDYVEAAEGAFSEIVKIVVGKPKAECMLYYLNKSVEINLGNCEFVTGYEVYRSTQKSKGYKKIATTYNNAYLDDTVASGTYYYKVKPFYYDTTTKKKNYGDYSEPQGIKLIMQYLHANITQTKASQAKISWNKVRGAAVYEIYMKEDIPGAAFKQIATTTKQSYTVKNLEADTIYSFEIRACKEANNMKSYYQSSSIWFNTGIHEPENIRVTKREASVKGNTMTIKTTIKWDRVYGAKKYKIEAYDNVKGKTVVLKTINKASTTTYTLKNTKKIGEPFRYSDVKVIAVNGSQSCEADVYDSIEAMSIPTNVKVKKNNASSAKLTWDKVAAADIYYIYRTTPMGQEWYIGESKKTSFIDKKLAPGVKYTYRVIAGNSKFDVTSSTYVMGAEGENMVKYTHALSKTTITSVKNASAKKATITWKKSAYAAKYIVYRSTSKKGTYKKIKTTTKNTYTDTKLTKGKTYYYKIMVQTVNDAGMTVKSAMSAPKAVRITK